MGLNDRRRALVDTIHSLEEAAQCYQQGGYPPNPKRAAPISAERCRQRAAALRAELAKLGRNT